MDSFNTSKPRNPEIEFWRFFFAVVIFLFHMNVIPYGLLGVDFFFLLTGILMMRSIQRAKSNNSEPLSTSQFVIRKVKAFYPELLAATLYTLCVALFVTAILHKVDTAILVKTFINGVIPLKMTGIFAMPQDYNGSTWYLSSMLIGIIVTYPFLIRFSHHPLLFIIGIFICGFLCTVHGQLGNVYTHLGITYEGNFRAIGELLLGATCYHTITHFQKIKLTYFGEIVSTFIKYSCICGIVFIMFQNHAKWHGVALCLALMSLVFIFSKHGIDRHIFNNRICLFLGALSLPLYITHRISTTILNDLLSAHYPPLLQFLFVFH